MDHVFERQLDTWLTEVAPASRVACFDADGTLWSADLGEAMFRAAAQHGLLSAPGGVASPTTVNGWWQLYSARVAESAVEAYGWCCRAMAGNAVSTLEALAVEVTADFYPTQRRPEVEGWVHRMHAAGWQVWVVSASNRWAVIEGAKRLGIPAQRVLGVELSLADSVATAELAQPVPYAQEKVAALGRRGIAEYALAFGNTLGDANLLEHARLASVAVTPDAALYREAVRRGWWVTSPDATGCK